MRRSSHVRVVIDLRRVRQNTQDIACAVGVPVLAVVKADAYGLGAENVTRTISDLVEGFCVFSPDEATEINLWAKTGKPTLALGPPAWPDPQQYLAHHIRPAVSIPDQARTLKTARPILCVDTGQQRFACPIDQVAQALRAGDCDTAFTHAGSLQQVRLLQVAINDQSVRLHAAGSSLLNEPAARLDAVRPGLALYVGAARVSTRLVETRKNTGPAGYTGFVVPHHGVILAGYSNGLRPGPCLINGRLSRILETGMQTAFVETNPTDRAGDEVILLGDSLTEAHIASEWNSSPQECLV